MSIIIENYYVCTLVNISGNRPKFWNWQTSAMENIMLLCVFRELCVTLQSLIIGLFSVCGTMLPRLYDEDIRVARNAAWVLTHKPITQIRTLPYNDLIDLIMATPDTSLRRLTLNLMDQLYYPLGILRIMGLPMDAELMRTDFLDFCMLHMHMPEEPPGVQALCMKLAHRMCLPYPELLHEFYETLSLMQPEDCKPGMKHLINKMKNLQ